MTKYRELYKEYYRIEFGREFDIHHIDRNRLNNDINNLILLPKKIHLLYHTRMDICYDKLNMFGGIAFPFEAPHVNEHEEILNEMLKINLLIKPWVELKSQLDFNIFNHLDEWKVIKIQMKNNEAIIEKIS